MSKQQIMEKNQRNTRLMRSSKQQRPLSTTTNRQVRQEQRSKKVSDSRVTAVQGPWQRSVPTGFH